MGYMVKKSDFSLLNALTSTNYITSSKPRYFAIHTYILVLTPFSSFENSTSTLGSFRENLRLNHRCFFMLMSLMQFFSCLDV